MFSKDSHWFFIQFDFYFFERRRNCSPWSCKRRRNVLPKAHYMKPQFFLHRGWFYFFVLITMFYFFANSCLWRRRHCSPWKKKKMKWLEEMQTWFVSEEVQDDDVPIFECDTTDGRWWRGEASHMRRASRFTVLIDPHRFINAYVSCFVQ